MPLLYGALDGLERRPLRAEAFHPEICPQRAGAFHPEIRLPNFEAFHPEIRPPHSAALHPKIPPHTTSFFFFVAFGRFQQYRVASSRITTTKQALTTTAKSPPANSSR